MSTEPMSTEKAAWFPSLDQAGEAIALVDGERSLNYTELNDAVSRVVAGLLNGEASLKEELSLIHISEPTRPY